MNAHTPAWRHYLAAVDAFCVGQDEETREMRARIMHMRDRAGQIMQQHDVDWAAGHILSTVQSLGCAYSTAGLDTAELQTLRTSMAELFRIAASLEVIGRGR